MKEKKSAAYYPAPGEFFLILGNFRREESTPHMLSYYGFSSFFTEAKMPDGGTPEQDCFYRVVRHTIQSVFDRCAFIVTVQDFTKGTFPAWINQLLQVQMLASQQGGKLTKYHTQNCDLYRFAFKEFCSEFFEKMNKVINVDCCYESIYMTCSGEELNVCDSANGKEGAIPPSILIWIDEEHPVLGVQMDFTYPLEKLTNALGRACQLEGWKFTVQGNVRNI